jgi:hypothetical protein
MPRRHAAVPMDGDRERRGAKESNLWNRRRAFLKLQRLSLCYVNNKLHPA